MDSLTDRQVEAAWRSSAENAFVPPARIGRHGAVRSPEAIADELEWRCARLRLIDPECGPDVHAAAIGLLCGVEAVVDAMRFRSELTNRPLDLRFLPELTDCERDLDAIAPLWGRSSATD